jgi:hypothetical protein
MSIESSRRREWLPNKALRLTVELAIARPPAGEAKPVCHSLTPLCGKIRRTADEALSAFYSTVEDFALPGV